MNWISTLEGLRHWITLQWGKTTPHLDEQALCLDTEVRKTLRKVIVWKAAGPDSISCWVLTHCKDKLAGVLTDIFNTSLDHAVVLSCFKTSAIIPVPKKPTITCLNDYRSVALPLMCFERMVKDHILLRLSPTFDPYQFAYHTNRSTEDVISSALHLSLEHLEKRNTRANAVCGLITFNTIFPQHLVSKMDPLGFRAQWCLHFLHRFSGWFQTVASKSGFWLWSETPIAKVQNLEVNVVVTRQNGSAIVWGKVPQHPCQNSYIPQQLLPPSHQDVKSHSAFDSSPQFPHTLTLNLTDSCPMSVQYLRHNHA